MTSVPKGVWCCPWHQCQSCGRRSSQCGKMLMHCICCPVAYCLDCFPTTEEMVEVPLPATTSYRFEESGFPSLKSWVFFECKECKDEKKAKAQEYELKLAAQQKEKELKLAALKIEQRKKKEEYMARKKKEKAEAAVRQVKSVVQGSYVPVTFTTVLFKSLDGKIGANVYIDPDLKRVIVSSVASHCINIRPQDQIIGVNGNCSLEFNEIVPEIISSPRAVQLMVRRLVFKSCAVQENALQYY